MNTADEITNLRTLAENAGYTGQIIRYLTELEKIYQGVANGTMNQNLIDAKLKRAETLQTLIAEAASKVDYLSLIHISEPTRRNGISYAVFCLKKIFLMIRRPPRSTLGLSSAASDVYKRQVMPPSGHEYCR